MEIYSLNNKLLFGKQCRVVTVSIQVGNHGLSNSKNEQKLRQLLTYSHD